MMNKELWAWMAMLILLGAFLIVGLFGCDKKAIVAEILRDGVDCDVTIKPVKTKGQYLYIIYKIYGISDDGEEIKLKASIYNCKPRVLNGALSRETGK